MNSTIDISVILPMYNSEKYIRDAIQSVLEQEQHGFHYEIVVVDDGSTDRSVDIVKNIKSDNIKLVVRTQNGGLSAARNTGLQAASGNWVQFLDSDDRLGSNLFSAFEKGVKPNINCYIFSLLSEFSTHKIRQDCTQVIDKRAFAYFGGVWNKFIRRDICLPFKEGYLHEDIIFNVDMMNADQLQIGLIKDAYYFYNRKNPNSITANFNKKEYYRMYDYIYSRLPCSDELTKKYVLEISLGLLMYMPFWMSLKIATISSIKLFRYIPSVLRRGIRHCVTTKELPL